MKPDNITLGNTYHEKYLNTELGHLGSSKFQGLITLNRVKTDYGWKITQGTNYISIHKVRLYIYPNGTAKSVTKVNRNYCTPYQYTIYYDTQGREIKDNNNSTRKELSYFKSLNQ